MWKWLLVQAWWVVAVQGVGVVEVGEDGARQEVGWSRRELGPATEEVGVVEVGEDGARQEVGWSRRELGPMTEEVGVVEVSEDGARQEVGPATEEVGVVEVGEDGARQEVGPATEEVGVVELDLLERMTALESLLATMTRTQSILEDSLRQESRARKVLEAELQWRMEETEGGLERLERKVEAMEADLNMLVVLSSRLRSVQEEQRDLTDLLYQTQRDVDQMRRQVRQHGVALTSLRADVTQTANMTNQLHLSLQTYTLLLDESSSESEDVDSTLADLHTSLHNLTVIVEDLMKESMETPLLLCPTPYRKVGGSCLYLLETPGTWEWGRAECSSLGATVGGMGDLAVPSDFTAFRTFVGYLDSASPYLWVGGERTAQGEWMWVTGAAMEEVPWDLGEPDDTPEQRHLCIRSAASVKFHDCTVSASLGAVCQVY